MVVQEINRYYPEKERKKKPVVVQDHQHTKLQFKQEKALQEITTMSISKPSFESMTVIFMLQEIGTLLFSFHMCVCVCVCVRKCMGSACKEETNPSGGSY